MTNDNDSTRALMAQIDSLTIQRDAAEDLARKQAARACAAEWVTASARLEVQAMIGLALDCKTRWSRGHEAIVESAKDMMFSTASVGGRWAPRADFDALVESEIHARADRDAAQQMVAKLHEAAQSLVNDLDESDDVASCDFGRSRVPLEEALALSAPIAGRWCLASERDEAASKLAGAVHAVADAVAAHDAATARAEKAEALAEMYWRMGSPSQADMAEVARERDRHAAKTVKLGTDIDAATARESELGLQVVAQAARLRLADGVVAAARVFVDEDNWQTCPHCAGEGANPDDHKGETRCPVCCGGLQSYRDDRADCAETSITAALTALAAWDAVPGMEP